MDDGTPEGRKRERDRPRDRGPLSREDVTADSPFTLPGFFAELAEGRLTGAACSDCGHAMVPPRPACYACGSRAVAVEEQPRAGEVVSHTAVHTPPPAFEDRAPYTVGIVELASGARLTGRIDADYDEVAIGDPVDLAVRDPGDAELAAALDHETDWPIHVFELR